MNCLKCGVETTNTKFCGRACSASYNTKGRKHSIETKRKISNTLGGVGKAEEEHFCKLCGHNISSVRKTKLCDTCKIGEFLCDVCGKICKTELGLKSHKEQGCINRKIGIDSQGYEYFTDNENKFKYVHRSKIEELLGRKLKTNEVVHHKDEIKKNNDIENLELMTISKHSKLHADMRR
jgi:hypothetical protein